MKKKKTVMKALMTISQFGINMLVPIFMCSFAGMYIDRALGTSFVMIILFFIGGAAGFRNIYILAHRIINDDPDAHSPYGRRRRHDVAANHIDDPGINTDIPR